MGRAWKIEDLPPALRMQVVAQLEDESARRRSWPGRECVVNRVGLLTAKNLNKTEMKFYTDVLCNKDGLVLGQCLVLPFGDGTSYRPDFVRIGADGVTVYEVKGGHYGAVAWSRHGVERFRRARDRFSGVMKFELWVYRNRKWEQEL